MASLRDANLENHPHFPYDTDEKAVFGRHVYPDDNYDADGTYWADLPFWKRFNFVNSVNNKEAARELAIIGRMAKRDPLSPVSAYFRNMVLPGAGLGLEGYESAGCVYGD